MWLHDTRLSGYVVALVNHSESLGCFFEICFLIGSAQAEDVVVVEVIEWGPEEGLGKPLTGPSTSTSMDTG